MEDGEIASFFRVSCEEEEDYGKSWVQGSLLDQSSDGITGQPCTSLSACGVEELRSDGR